MTKCVKKLCVRLKCTNWLKNLVLNYEENFDKKFFLEIELILVGRIGWENFVKEKGEKLC